MTCTCASILKSSVNWNQRFFAVVENDETLCPNEREMLINFFWHVFGGTRRNSVFSSFNWNLFSIIKYLTSEMHASNEEIALCTCWGRIQVSV